jgi:FKBP-type peptidyl-prolyl cis-trans isomerase 2
MGNPHPTEGGKKMRQYVVLGIIAILLMGCVNQPPASNYTGGPPIINANGSTNLSNPTQGTQSAALSPNYTVSVGDQVWINYTVWDKGRVLDTNNATLANQSGIYNPGRDYTAPFNFTVMFNQNIINGMISSIIGMHVNETLDFDVAPADGYGPYDPKKVVVVSRYFTMNLTQVIPHSYFDQRNLTVKNGTGFTDPQVGTVFVTDFNDQNVTVFLFGISVIGTNFTINNVPQQTVDSHNVTATIERTFEMNKTYLLPDPTTGAPTYYRTLNETNDSIALDGNNPLANETLRFRVTLLKVQHGSQTLGNAG